MHGACAHLLSQMRARCDGQSLISLLQVTSCHKQWTPFPVSNCQQLSKVVCTLQQGAGSFCTSPQSHWPTSPRTQRSAVLCCVVVDCHARCPAGTHIEAAQAAGMRCLRLPASTDLGLVLVIRAQKRLSFSEPPPQPLPPPRTLVVHEAPLGSPGTLSGAQGSSAQPAAAYVRRFGAHQRAR